mmetsp:Transcript_19930/g.57238  ORF Transcript_19930/g.57238 Transcript_19930/m.57238 type:complete len:189 (-) Transcript_19930:239-805(-)
MYNMLVRRRSGTMTSMMYRLVLFVTLLAVAATAFAPAVTSRAPASAAATVGSALGMGLFDGLFGGDSPLSAAQDTRVAEASHILLTGPTAAAECEQLKVQIYKDALGWFGKPEDGVEPEKLIKAFGNKARATSTCPSKAQGGSLGYFPRGQMVKQFDDVAFGAQVGIIHGPVETEFGSHLILITDRTE